MIRTSLVVVAFVGWSTVAAAQPAAGAPAPLEPVEAVQPSQPPEPPPPPGANMVVAVPPPAPEAKPAGKKISVTVAPILLIVSIVEVTAEYRVMNKLGVSVTLGAGKRTFSSSTSSSEASGTEIEAGVQARYYLLGSFRHGMEAGVQILEEYVKFDEPLPADILGVKAGGFTVGGFLGYKIATRVGFTFEAQLGARYLVVEPGGQGMVGSIQDEEKWLPILHLNVGWSF